MRDELAALAPKPDEEEKLAGERQLMRAGSTWARPGQALAELEQGRGAVTRAAHGAPPVERSVDKAAGCSSRRWRRSTAR